MSLELFIGIDLGTTFSVVAYVDKTGHVVCLPNRDGEALTPSTVMLDDDGEFVVGRRAQAALTSQPERVAEAFKRQMGIEGASRRLGDRDCSPAFLSSCVLRQLVEDARRTIGPIGGAVITVPAHFGDRERTATMEAARLARLDVVAMINEPTAAALSNAFDAYVAAGGDPGDLERATIASTAPGVSVICDLGGGTFDVTVIRINGSEFDVLATGGSLSLGGRDWDERITDAMERHLFDQGGPDPHQDLTARARMRAEAQTGKHVLSVKNEVAIPAPYDRVADMPLTREQFERLSEPLLERVRTTIEDVLQDAGVQWSGVEDLLLIGGATRMPMVRRLAGDLSGLTPNTRLQPDLIVAQGAAVYAAIMQVQDVTDATTYSLAELAKQTTPHHAFDDAFAAAAGAVNLNDVNAHSLGVMVRSPRYDRKVNNILIPRNTPLPASGTRVFVTHSDNQARVRIPVLEGEVRDLDACTEVGVCTINGLPENLPKGSPVEVTISYDANGTVRVKAEELTTHTATETVLNRVASDPRVGRPSDPRVRRNVATRASTQTQDNGKIDELAEAVAQLAIS